MNTDPHTLKAYYLEHFRGNRAAILEAAAMGLDPPITGCLGWDVAGLTAHMGRVESGTVSCMPRRKRMDDRGRRGSSSQ